jgi:hypothetical protein
MRNRQLLILALTTTFICICILLASYIIGMISTRNFGDAQQSFKGSAYLQGVWPKSCTYDLNSSSNIVLMARLREKSGNAYLDCWWNHKVVNITGGVLSVDGGRTDIDPVWSGCGQDPAFTGMVKDAVHNKTGLIPLLGHPPEGIDDTYYILVSKCMQGPEGCSCKNITGNYTSVAYALLDEGTGEVYW